MGGLSDAFHRLFRERLARGTWRDRPRPIKVNNWEGTYFDFDAERLLAMATVARELGIELFVLDDGWFGKRDDDTTSLGDWFVDRRKLPDGIDGLARAIEALGLEVRPVDRAGDGQRAQRAVRGPPGLGDRRARPEAHREPPAARPRHGPAGDRRPPLRCPVGGPRSAPISYVKWDMNRNITEPWSPALPPDRQGEFFHRYILGVYDLYERLTSAFPDILFESCAGGGGRFDPGMLAFAPQAWTSDDTDAIERLRIQWGTSLAYPVSSMAAHVSAVPNHQVGRITPLATRAAVAFFGVLGYELDPTDADRRRAAPGRRPGGLLRGPPGVFQYGRFVRLRSPFEGDGNTTAWMSISPDQRRAVVGYYQALNVPAPGADRVRLRGLDPDVAYGVSVWPAGDDSIARANSVVRGGDDLMAAGLLIPAREGGGRRPRRLLGPAVRSRGTARLSRGGPPATIRPRRVFQFMTASVWFALDDAASPILAMMMPP